MRRPVRVGHVTVMDAINMVIIDRFAERDATVKRQEKAEDEARKRNFVPSGDPLRDAYIKQGWGPSRQLQQMMNELVSDAQFLLSQWLCDGKLQAFYRDPLFGQEHKIAASAWETAATDKALYGGDYHPSGDSKLGGPVRLLRSDVEKVLRGAADARVPALQDATAPPLAEEGREQSSASPAAAPTPTKPEGKPRARKGVAIALQEVYGSTMGVGISPKKRAFEVAKWLEKQKWEVPKDVPRTILRILKPDKQK